MAPAAASPHVHAAKCSCDINTLPRFSFNTHTHKMLCMLTPVWRGCFASPLTFYSGLLKVWTETRGNLES